MAPVRLQAAGDLQQHLRDQYKDKIFVLRGFPQSADLRYDSGGMPATGAANSGDWTVAGFVRIESLDLSHHRLTIHAERLHLGVAPGMGFQLIQFSVDKKGKDAKKLRIEVAIDPEVTSPENADAALARVFLTAQDRFAELVPDYWKPCVRAASTGRAAKDLVDCHFSPEFAAIPGVVYRSEENPELKEPDSDSTAVYGEIVRDLRPRDGITQPKIAMQGYASFSEEARQAKYGGNVTLSIIVDKTGQPSRIRIIRPTGMGLDRRAVETVAKWQFNPGIKDGQPVAMGPIPVQVDFHLY